MPSNGISESEEFNEYSSDVNQELVSQLANGNHSRFKEVSIGKILKSWEEKSKIPLAPITRQFNYRCSGALKDKKIKGLDATPNQTSMYQRSEVTRDDYHLVAAASRERGTEVERAGCITQAYITDVRVMQAHNTYPFSLGLKMGTAGASLRGQVYTTNNNRFLYTLNKNHNVEFGNPEEAPVIHKITATADFYDFIISNRMTSEFLNSTPTPMKDATDYYMISGENVDDIARMILAQKDNQLRELFSLDEVKMYQLPNGGSYFFLGKAFFETALAGLKRVEASRLRNFTVVDFTNFPVCFIPYSNTGVTMANIESHELFANMSNADRDAVLRDPSFEASVTLRMTYVLKDDYLEKRLNGVEK